MNEDDTVKRSEQRGNGDNKLCIGDCLALLRSFKRRRLTQRMRYTLGPRPEEKKSKTRKIRKNGTNWQEIQIECRVCWMQGQGWEEMKELIFLTSATYIAGAGGRGKSRERIEEFLLPIQHRIQLLGWMIINFLDILWPSARSLFMVHTGRFSHTQVKKKFNCSFNGPSQIYLWEMSIKKNWI